MEVLFRLVSRALTLPYCLVQCPSPAASERAPPFSPAFRWTASCILVPPTATPRSTFQLLCGPPLELFSPPLLFSLGHQYFLQCGLTAARFCFLKNLPDVEPIPVLCLIPVNKSKSSDPDLGPIAESVLFLPKRDQNFFLTPGHFPSAVLLRPKTAEHDLHLWSAKGLRRGFPLSRSSLLSRLNSMLVLFMGCRLNIEGPPSPLMGS